MSLAKLTVGLPACYVGQNRVILKRDRFLFMSIQNRKILSGMVVATFVTRMFEHLSVHLH